MLNRFKAGLLAGICLFAVPGAGSEPTVVLGDPHSFANSASVSAEQVRAGAYFLLLPQQPMLMPKGQLSISGDLGCTTPGCMRLSSTQADFPPGSMRPGMMIMVSLYPEAGTASGGAIKIDAVIDSTHATGHLKPYFFNNSTNGFTGKAKLCANSSCTATSVAPGMWSFGAVQGQGQNDPGNMYLPAIKDILKPGERVTPAFEVDTWMVPTCLTPAAGDVIRENDTIAAVVDGAAIASSFGTGPHVGGCTGTAGHELWVRKVYSLRGLLTDNGVGIWLLSVREGSNEVAHSFYYEQTTSANGEFALTGSDQPGQVIRKSERFANGAILLPDGANRQIGAKYGFRISPLNGGYFEIIPKAADGKTVNQPNTIDGRYHNRDPYYLPPGWGACVDSDGYGNWDVTCLSLVGTKQWIAAGVPYPPGVIAADSAFFKRINSSASDDNWYLGRYALWPQMQIVKNKTGAKKAVLCTSWGKQNKESRGFWFDAVAEDGPILFQPQGPDAPRINGGPEPVTVPKGASAHVMVDVEANALTITIAQPAGH